MKKISFQTKTIEWTKIFRYVFGHLKTETFEKALLMWTGPILKTSLTKGDGG